VKETLTPDQAEAIHTIKALKERVWVLEEAVVELLLYASPTPKISSVAAALCKGGYTSELVPRLTRVGPVNVAERIEELRKLVPTTDRKEHK
jgi:hypothetical protein